MKKIKILNPFFAMTIFVLFCALFYVPVAGIASGAVVIPDTAVEIENTPAGNISATDVQGAINELDTEKEPAKGLDDNYVTDDEKIILGNTSGTNTGDSSGHSGLAASGANSDITALSGITTPLSISQGGNGNTQGSGMLNTNRFMIGATDFTTGGGQNAGLPTWVITAINSGTSPVSNVGNPNHPGIISLKSSTTANSGYGFTTAATAFLLAGGEATELIFVVASGLSTTTCKFGFMNTYTITAPVDGAWINIANLVLDGRTSSNSTSSTTGTTYTLTANTWYRMKIVINSDATRVDYYLYAENGTQLWTNNLTTNIPTTTGRDVGHGVIATDAGTTATALMSLDFMNLYIDRNLIR